MGIDKFFSWMMCFGFGDLMGIDIYEESKVNMLICEWKMVCYKVFWY